MFVWYADSVKREARAIYAQVKVHGCKACPRYEWCEKRFEDCRLNILRTLQTRYDDKVALQQNYGIY